MPLYHESGISVENWVEMKEDVPARYEVDRLNDQATLFFGSQDNYVLNICRGNLDQMITLATSAKNELDVPDLNDVPDK